MKVGISAIQIDFPKLYLPIEDLAENRNIEALKLIKGLGLQRMSFPDVHQDTVSFAANAILKLLAVEQLKPSEIDRIYVGTESGVDSSKPVASFLLPIIEEKYGVNSTEHCDVVDLTFACIGAVDAMQTCLDYVRLRPEKKCIVIASDVAKYDLGSGGEYTQGAGAVAMLIEANPKMLSFDLTTGVSTEGVFDFFKPRRTVSKKKIDQNSHNPEWNGVLENEISIYKEQPVFDGQYSNECYIKRIKAAYFHFKEQKQDEKPCYENWEFIAMHLPYCFQGRRTFQHIVAEEHPELLTEQKGETPAEKMKALTKSAYYQELVQSKLYPSEIASSKIGNIYTGSIFLGLASALYHKKDRKIKSNTIGFIAYGSGSKSKVFEAELENGWKEQIEKTNLFKALEQTHKIDFKTYEALHKKEISSSVVAPKNEVALVAIEKENPVLIGKRDYVFMP